MPLTTGTRLGPYEIQSALGTGGMGEVYKARDTRLERTVAIKVLPESLSRDPQFRERFDREARAISQPDHIIPAADGQRFLMKSSVGGREESTLNIVVNWTSALQK